MGLQWGEDWGRLFDFLKLREAAGHLVGGWLNAVKRLLEFDFVAQDLGRLPACLVV